MLTQYVARETKYMLPPLYSWNMACQKPGCVPRLNAVSDSVGSEGCTMGKYTLVFLFVCHTLDSMIVTLILTSYYRVNSKSQEKYGVRFLLSAFHTNPDPQVHELATKKKHSWHAFCVKHE